MIEMFKTLKNYIKKNPTDFILSLLFLLIIISIYWISFRVVSILGC